MHIAILETGRINPAIADRFPRYPDMFRSMFDAASLSATGGAPDTDSFTFTAVPVLDGEFPATVDDYDGYLVTGSAAGVYDDYDWIDPLKAFIRDLHAADKPLAGVCFGHQIIAEALGGTCIKWPGGWGVGPFDVALDNTPRWMPQRDQVRLIHVHQDQVTRLPEGATHLGATGFCDNAMFYVGDSVFCMQGHPEFEADYTGALLTLREDSIGTEKVATALEGLKQEHEGIIIARWILSFFAGHAASRAAETAA